jgi:hypothetical protein
MLIRIRKPARNSTGTRSMPKLHSDKEFTDMIFVLIKQKNINLPENSVRKEIGRLTPIELNYQSGHGLDA